MSKISEEQIIRAYDKYNKARLDLQELGAKALEQEAPEASICLGNIWRLIFEVKYKEEAMQAATILMPHLAFSKWEYTKDFQPEEDERA